ncbi:hypothetical protein A0128_09675 [Leptospira tipperaryensis]|uniref:Alpha/beta hydrolase n=1 Tax=Leptospira tipperaryensis TaxID=2564040 RepID=A0A1D7UWX2_9LEPT|nr:hypothetical protein [Leptospira tipperaryensis]AOP34087.1 hypothetical protein A0128_09675 [Leptospira tipperaryensis]
MSNRISIQRLGSSTQAPLFLLPDFDFPGRRIQTESFASAFSLRVFEVPIQSFQTDFPRYEEWIESISEEIRKTKGKVKLLGEGYFSGIVFELIKKFPDRIEAACIVNPPFPKVRDPFPWFPKNVEWILERFPWNPWFLLSEDLHLLFETLERSFRKGMEESNLLPTVLFTGIPGMITEQMKASGKELQSFRVYRIESADRNSIQVLFKELIVKILAEIPISSVQKKSNFKIEPGF